MAATQDDALVLFPGALGDFICFLPTLLALRARHAGRLRVLAQPSLLALLRLPGSDGASIHRREVADLFTSAAAPADATVALLGGFGAVYTWTGAAAPQVAQRLSAINTGPVGGYSVRGMRDGEHAVEYYARCAGLAPAAGIDGIIADDSAWIWRWLAERGLDGRRLFVIHPGSGASRKNWRGFSVVARGWVQRTDAPVVVLHGPAEAPRRPNEGRSSLAQRRPESLREPRVLHVRDLALAQVAALLRHSTLYLGNDSGISHLAAAVGVRGVVLFGSSDPRTWAPRGGTVQVVHAPEPCGACGADVFCTHRLAPSRVTQALWRDSGCGAEPAVERRPRLPVH
jgi:hypothetical protein